MRLKELRESKGLTQKEVAEIIGYSEISYARYENGKREPDISTLCKLAEYFNVTVDYLIGRSKVISPMIKMPDNVASHKKQIPVTDNIHK